MGCCSPEYRKTVVEEEKRINQKGRDSLPLLVKVSVVLITAGGIITLYFI